MEELIAFFFLIFVPVVLGTWDIICTILDKIKQIGEYFKQKKNINEKSKEKINEKTNDKEKKE
jgi:hypothetical protein